MEEPSFEELQRKVGVTFVDEGLLRIAFTHPSIRGKIQSKGTESYRRLEFLGDAVIRLVTSEDIYKSLQGSVEALHNNREKFVPNDVLTEVGERLGLRRYLRGSGSRDVLNSQRVVAKVYESLTGAIFLDRGYNVAADFVVRTLVKRT